MDTKAELLMLKGAIYDLPAQSQENIKKHSDFFKAYLTEHGEEVICPRFHGQFKQRF